MSDDDGFPFEGDGFEFNADSGHWTRRFRGGWLAVIREGSRCHFEWLVARDRAGLLPWPGRVEETLADAKCRCCREARELASRELNPESPAHEGGGP